MLNFQRPLFCELLAKSAFEFVADGGSLPLAVLVLDHANAPFNAGQDQHYFVYPIHVSMSFLMTRGLTSAMYLLLLRLLHRDYAAAFRLAESVASDSAFDTAARHQRWQRPFWRAAQPQCRHKPPIVSRKLRPARGR